MKETRVYKCTECPRTRTIEIDRNRSTGEFPPTAGLCFCSNAGRYLPVGGEDVDVLPRVESTEDVI